MGWQEALERQKLRGKVEQLVGSDDVYRENCLYEHFMREYQKRPDTKYYGEFGAAHVLMSAACRTLLWLVLRRRVHH